MEPEDSLPNIRNRFWFRSYILILLNPDYTLRDALSDLRDSKANKYLI
jgi:hypothetical protein